MNDPTDWRNAFPFRAAIDASDALLQGWSELATIGGPEFNPRTREPRLTKRLKIYVENHVAHDRGLLGTWSAEDVVGKIDRQTGELIKEHRTDVAYGWNDASSQFKLVFEFKRLHRGKRDRNEYLAGRG